MRSIKPPTIILLCKCTRGIHTYCAEPGPEPCHLPSPQRGCQHVQTPSQRPGSWADWVSGNYRRSLSNFHRVISSIFRIQSTSTWTESRKSETVSPMCTCWQITTDKKLLGEELWWVFWGWSVVFSNFEIGNAAQNCPYTSSIQIALETC